jgi:Tfp pilus assembly PilM family ATPase
MESVIGFDLGRDWIKILQLTPGKKILRLGKIPIPEETDNAKLPAIVVNRINELFKSLKLPKENIVVNFRGSHVLARTYLPPSTQSDAFEHWFVESIETMIPGTPISEVIYSFDLLPSGRALIAFARIREIEKLLSILNCCGITPVSIDASCLALYDCFRDHPLIQSKQNQAIVDINSTATYILLVKDGEPYISAEIPLGGKNISKGRDKYRNFAYQLGS